MHPIQNILWALPKTQLEELTVLPNTPSSLLHCLLPKNPFPTLELGIPMFYSTVPPMLLHYLHNY